MSDLIGIDEVAKMLDTPVNTLRYWRHTGEGPRSARIGRSVKYRRADVEAWLEEQFAKAGA